MGCRCFWDSDTDAYAEDTYRNVRTPHRAAASRDSSTCPRTVHRVLRR
jgi:hypothetical protein